MPAAIKPSRGVHQLALGVTPIVPPTAETDVDGRRYIYFPAASRYSTRHLHPKVGSRRRAATGKLVHASVSDLRRELHRAGGAFDTRSPRAPVHRRPYPDHQARSFGEPPHQSPRFHTTRSAAVIAFSGCFHGRTLACIQPHRHVQPYRPASTDAPEVYHLPYPCPYHGVTLEHHCRRSKPLFKATVARRACGRSHRSVWGRRGLRGAVDFCCGLSRPVRQPGIVLIADSDPSDSAAPGACFRHRARRGCYRI